VKKRKPRRAQYSFFFVERVENYQFLWARTREDHHDPEFVPEAVLLVETAIVKILDPFNTSHNAPRVQRYIILLEEERVFSANPSHGSLVASAAPRNHWVQGIEFSGWQGEQIIEALAETL